ncbi:hypothetical protein KSX_04350 [Ktedonospora formicarum]|uniref:Uncharacterized protein n=1 Tax=Ktedonospora formicarum TaxID=2778364 RepID=A0A8J3HR23_9CHLR|nr:hypothetical protein KSX_04350 [Ktedonospora formicarum]
MGRCYLHQKEVRLWCITEVGTTEVGFAEVGITKVGFREVGTTEIGYDRLIRQSPLIPCPPLPV